MKTVLFEVAKALKEAGYPQEYNVFGGTTCHYKNESIIQHHSMIGLYENIECAAPTYLDAWLWLWREKKIRICLEDAEDSKEPEIERGCYVGTKQLGGICSSQEFADPEDAIVDIIEYFVKNNLIK